MKNTTILLVSLILLVSSCSKDENTEKDLTFHINEYCGMCGEIYDVTISKKETVYIYKNDCDEREYTNKVETSKENWEKLTELFSMTAFKEVDLQTCGVCVDGCDVELKVENKSTEHSIKYNSLEDEKLADIKDFLQELERQTNIAGNPGGEIVAYKPNIYLYPEQNQQTIVELSFPKGGAVIKSEPYYNYEWNVNIETNGLIDNKYGFLFYESSQPDEFQYKTGWVIKKENLETFFTENMQELQFNTQEIKDFIEYWIPLLQDKPYYNIYPQFNTEIDKLIELNITPAPNSVNRLFYCVKGVDTDSDSLEKPTLPTFKREGFTVMEWGVIIK